MIKFLGSLLQCIGQIFCTNLMKHHFLDFLCFIFFQLFIFCYFIDSFYTLHSMTLISPSFLHELVLNNLNDIHGKPKQSVVILTACLPKCVHVGSRVLCIYLGGLSPTINIQLVVYFVYGRVQLTFDFYVQLFRSTF